MTSTRTPLIAGNWKMHKTVAESESLVRDIINGDRRKDADVLVAPPFTSLHAVARLVDTSDVGLAAQNMHWEKQGAYTGEVSPLMLADLGVEFVILGHSERRHIFGEKDEGINRKVISALAHGLKPILCVGETLEERRAEKIYGVLEAQLLGGLSGLQPDETGRVTIAYEPVWAIGTGHTATPDQAQAVHRLIRQQLVDLTLCNKDLANRVRILYGGSVKASNATEIMAQPDVDGVLVGGASLSAGEFLGIINF